MFDMQEDSIKKLDENQREVADMKTTYEHQLTEYRRHIQQLEIENQAYKQEVEEIHK